MTVVRRPGLQGFIQADEGGDDEGEGHPVSLEHLDGLLKELQQAHDVQHLLSSGPQLRRGGGRVLGLAARLSQHRPHRLPGALLRHPVDGREHGVPAIVAVAVWRGEREAALLAQHLVPVGAAAEERHHVVHLQEQVLHDPGVLQGLLDHGVQLVSDAARLSAVRDFEEVVAGGGDVTQKGHQLLFVRVIPLGAAHDFVVAEQIAESYGALRLVQEDVTNVLGKEAVT